MSKKIDIPDDVINYCIDKKVSIAEGLTAKADSKIQSLEAAIAELKKDLAKLP
tara:strand:+ start:294 stop:452 length:159 start_codon:yes stop_codon:yes gene_type:complete